MQNVQDFVRTTLNQIKAGMPEGFRPGPVLELELNVISEESLNGGADLKVLDARAASNLKHAHKVKVPVICEEAIMKQQADQLANLRSLGSLFVEARKEFPELFNGNTEYVVLDKSSRGRKRR